MSAFNKVYDDFYFNGKTLSSLGGIIIRDDIGSNNSLLPEREAITTTALGVDGEIFYGVKIGKRVWNESVYFENIDNLDDIRSWLNVKQPTVFRYIGDEYEIKCIVSSAEEIEVYHDNGKYCGTFEVEFIAYNPYFIRSSKERIESSIVNLGWDNKITCGGNVDKNYPQLEFMFDGIQDIEVEINNYRFKVSKANCNLIVDSMTREVFDKDGNKINDFEGRYPILKSGENDFKIIEGNLKTFKVLDRARIY